MEDNITDHMANIEINKFTCTDRVYFCCGPNWFFDTWLYFCEDVKSFDPKEHSCQCNTNINSIT